MRLHRLEITAFGPFAETAVVDFDALGADGLFLLHGHTGAGKTTVLDAIAFAFYGRVPGVRHESKRLHSDHASPKTAPQVVLEATLSDRRLRLVRSPAHERPNSRGGITTSQHKATLTWLDGQGESLSRLSEIGEEVTRRLGMSADQFFQVALLPQGEFARFLRADNEDREKLLEKLFDTQRFSTAEQWLADRARTSRLELDAEEGRMQQLILQIATVAGAPIAETVSADDAVDWSQHLLQAARDALAAAETEEQRCRLADERSHAAVERHRILAERCERRDRAQRRVAEYAATAEQRAARQRELESARRADRFAAVLAEAKTMAATLGRQETAIAQAAGRLSGLLREPGSVDVPGAELLDPTQSELRRDADIATVIQQWQASLGALAEVSAESALIRQLASELAELQAETDAVTAALDQLTKRRANLPAELETAESRSRAAAQAHAQLPGVTAECARYRAAADAATEVVRRRREHATATTELHTARGAQLTAREQVVRVRERRLSGMAAELAAGLTAGEPCTVCGSREHPAPAEPTSDRVTRDDEAAAVEAERRAQTELDHVNARIAELEREIEGLLAQGGDADPAELAAAAVLATQRQAETAALADQATAADAQLARLRTEETDLAQKIQAAETRRSALNTKITAVIDRRDDIAARSRKAAGADATVEQRIHRLSGLTEAAVEFRDGRAQAATAGAHLTDLLTRVHQLAADAGFEVPDAESVAGTPDIAAWGRDQLRPYERLLAHVWRDESERTAIDEELAAAEREVAHARAELADPAIQEVAEATPGDAAVVDAEYRTARDALGTAAATRSVAAERVKDLQDLSAALWAAVAKVHPAQKAHAELADLAAVVAGRGANNRRMSLRSYVLAARLEEVALAATARLRRMSSGRYEFVHTDRQGSHGKRGGLGLDIRDEYTGSIRPAKTLSGGESFMAALSLALGLADTVAAESGGLRLDTIFIDEGFGGLDSDSLDAVMGVLDELRAGGRVVGIVSHVDEMRQRIPSRLQVLRGRTGSHLRQVSPPLRGF